jgi:chromosomal replication initiator protein
VLEQVFLRYEQNNVLPSVDDISSMLSRAGAPQPVDIDSILAVVASKYGCTSSELRENTKDNRLTLPRQTAMYLCRELLGESYPSIGHFFGGKDHSTVMYAVRKIEKMKVTNKDMNILITELTKQCRNALPKGEN